MTTRAIGIRAAIRTWSSLVCTVFLLLLCLTGLPLIFHEEIEHALGDAVEPPAMAPGTPAAPLDRVVEAVRTRRPGEFVQFLIWDRHEPDELVLSLAASPDAPPENNRLVVVDARTAQVLDEPKTQEGLMFVLFELHVDMFAGLPGNRRLRRDAAHGHLGAARRRHHRRARERPVPLDRAAQVDAPRMRVARVFGRPALLALASALGLVSALLGDGAWDVLSWLALGTPVAVIVRYAAPRRAARS